MQCAEKDFQVLITPLLNTKFHRWLHYLKQWCNSTLWLQKWRKSSCLYIYKKTSCTVKTKDITQDALLLLWARATCYVSW